ncbi:MAG: hypothetical protein MUC91_06320, partial [Verrucomicrobia bacterium]|nr:hypothetical protein [Verrucomicrobiota bacterium]
MEQVADQGLTIRIAGDWSLQQPAPSFEDVASHFDSGVPPTGVQFAMSDLGSYDSSLVSLLVAVARRCQEAKIQLDPGGIPEGVRQLLKIALAVPERKTHEAPERELFFTRLGKAGLTVGAGMVELFTFIGLSAVAFGRLLRGKAVFRAGDTW